MSSLLQTQRDYRRRLLAADAATARDLMVVYADLQHNLTDALDGLTRRISSAKLAGTEITQSWLFQEQRYRSLLQQAGTAYAEAAQTASGTVARTQTSATQLGAEAAEALVRSLAPPSIPLSWSMLPQSTIEAAIGFASDGSPLRALFDQLGPEASASLRRSLVRGIGLGYSPRKIAAEVHRNIGMSLTRALTISRTEVLRSYRQSQSDAYARNKDVVQSKMWHAQLDDRCCPVCASQHGTIAGVNEVMGTHVNCRCSWIPVTKSWAELGYGGIEDTNPKIEPGPDWFARQPSERQAAILGPGRLAAYRSGVPLRDMIGMRTDRRWGPTRYTLPLRDIQAAQSQALPMAVGAENLGIQRSLPGFGVPDLPLTRVARSFGDFDQAATWANANMPKLSANAGLRDYTGGGFRTTNTYLRDGKAGLRRWAEGEDINPERAYRTLLSESERNVKALDTAMSPLPVDVMVHRGTSGSTFGRFLKGNADDGWDLSGIRSLSGQVVTDSAYTSASLGPQAVSKLASRAVQVHITAPKGTPSAWLHNLSAYDDEYEMLLGRGLRQLVTRTEQIDGQWHVWTTILP